MKILHQSIKEVPYVYDHNFSTWFQQPIHPNIGCIIERFFLWYGVVSCDTHGTFEEATTCPITCVA